MSDEEKQWREQLKNILPPGASIPKEEELEYSFAIEYNGPPVQFKVPKVEPIDANEIPSAIAVADELPLAGVPIMEPISSQPRSRLSVPRPSYPQNGDCSTNTEAGTSKNNRATDNLQQQESKSIYKKLPMDKVHPQSQSESDQADDFSASITPAEGPTHLKSDNTSSANEIDFDNPSRLKPVTEGDHLQLSSSEHDECSVPSPQDSFHSSPQGSFNSGPSNRNTSASNATLHNEVGAKKRKKGMCDRCGKVNRLKEKETCLVCNAKYCANCVLRAMGSMPEGRKCVNCIGHAIHESKRSSLGKCSRILSNMLSPLEIQQIMKAEKECPANQLQPDNIYVNGRHLWPEEMAELLGCPNPPEKLKPGRYWYDKVIGFWGKEGHKPSQIITPNLNVGGELQQDASKGNTKVFINGREITKTEFKMLKVAGVQCAGEPHYWVDADGSYQEEGHNNPKGKIWGKASTRALCVLLSLPTPRKTGNSHVEDANNQSNRMLPDYLETKKPQKLLLLGYEGSGASTIFKQARLLYCDAKFSDEELQNIKLVIQSNLFRYISILLEGRERFEEEATSKEHKSSDESPTISGKREDSDVKNIYSINQRLKIFSDWLLRIVAMGEFDTFFPAATRENAPFVEELWKDPAIQATYKRRSELHMLPDVASYFLDRVMEVASNEYTPSDTDIIYAGGVPQSIGLTSCEFSLDHRSPHGETYNDDLEYHGLPARYQLIKVNSNGLGESYKWLDMFEDVRAVIFCVSLGDYNQMWTEEKGSLRNKMMLSKEFFENVVKHPCFRNTPFVLLLNKFDVFEEKIGSIPLTACEWFKDFNPVKAHNNNSSLVYQAYYYVAMKFKLLFASLRHRKLSVWQVKARDSDSVEEAFKFIREVLKWDEEKEYYLATEESFYTDTSSFSAPARQDN